MAHQGRKGEILIIGGGNAGISVAKALSEALPESSFGITVVTERKYHIHYPALLRVLVSNLGDVESLALNSYDKVFKPGNPGRIVHGKVVQLVDGMATLQDGRQLCYDWLVLASGTQWEGPLCFPSEIEEAHKWIESWRQKFAASKNIVLIGGGAAGVELSGELRHIYPDKNITIVHASPELLNEAYPMRLRQHAHEKLKKLGVNVMLGDRLGMPSAPNYSRVTTLNNVRIQADLVVPTRGGQASTAYLRSFDPSIVDYVGRVKVLPTFCVPLKNGKRNVFACGDIIDWNEQKGLGKIPDHTAVVVANLLATIKEQPPAKRYGGIMETIVITLGPEKGFTFVPIFGGSILGSWITRILKAKTLMVEVSRKELGYL